MYQINTLDHMKLVPFTYITNYRQKHDRQWFKNYVYKKKKLSKLHLQLLIMFLCKVLCFKILNMTLLPQMYSTVIYIFLFSLCPVKQPPRVCLLGCPHSSLQAEFTKMWIFRQQCVWFISKKQHIFSLVTFSVKI